MYKNIKILQCMGNIKMTLKYLCISKAIFLESNINQTNELTDVRLFLCAAALTATRNENW